MANIRASAAATTILVATASAVSIGIATAGGVTATAQPTPVIRASAVAVPMSVLENQTVLMSDFRSFDIGQVTIDVATVTDDVAISFNTSFSDTDAVTAADAVNTINTAKVVADSVTPADSATMSDDKFYYAPIGGMVNEHRIHQPLVNGEFVLTTDQNAGIVYTIRTESYSYMVAGYGLNENQLN